MYCDGRAWTRRHDQWLRAQRLVQPHTQLAFDVAYDAMIAALGRRDRLDQETTVMVVTDEYAPIVTGLGCLRGVSALTALGLAVEVGEWERLTGRTIGAFVKRPDLRS